MPEERVQRRLSAILAADVVGYSRLIGNDEAGTRARFNAHFNELVEPAIATHRGRIVKTTGDGVLSEFPSVVDAVQCAAEIQKGMAERNTDEPDDQRIQFRIGVNLGDVIIEDQDIHGDGVNVAARLETIAEPGGICISAAAFEQVQGKVDVAFDDLGSKSLKNISGAVRVYRVNLQGRGSDTGRPKRLRYPYVIAGSAGLLAIGLALVFWLSQSWVGPAGPSPPEAGSPIPSDRPSIAVLPFTNMSNDPEQEYFSDGVTEDLITDLSKLSGLFVIARNTAFTYKGRAVDVKQASSDLGVRYVLEGSVRRHGDNVRINAQLIDSTTGGHVWADRFDRELGDIFALQDDVTRKIVSALALELTSDDRVRLDRSGKETSPEVYDLYLRGSEALRRFTPESIAEARVIFLKALVIDPDYARSHAAIAFTHTASVVFFRAVNPEEKLLQALQYASKAVELDHTLPQAHFALSVIYMRRGLHDEAEAAAREAVKYDPNYADGHAQLANVLAYAGRASEALDMIQMAMRLNPRFSAPYIEVQGRAYFILRRYDQAIGQFVDCVSRDPESLTCRRFLAAAYGLAGRMEDAKWQAEEILSRDPDLTLQNDDHGLQFKNPDQRDLYYSGLRIAGIPEK